MSLNLENLNEPEIRDLMLSELKKDNKDSTIYLSPRLLPQAHQEYLDLIEEAIKTGDSNSFAASIQKSRILKARESYRKKTGGIGTRRVPRNAHTNLAEGEFNRFYLRALCLKALETGSKIQAYRAKPVSSQRSSSVELIGKTLEPNELLQDLRENIGQNPALKLPGGPNSGISGRLVETNKQV